MTEKKPDRSEIRFKREAKTLQKNLEKRKKQQEELQKNKLKKATEHGQTQN